MTSRRALRTPWLGAALAAIVVLAALAGPAGATVETLPPAATGASTEVMPAGAGSYGEEQPYRRDDAYVFSATRSLRQGGIHPAMAVLLAPATLVFDAVFFPFAVALEYLTVDRR